MGIYDSNIYAITDDCGSVKYVGRTRYDLKHRFNQHCSAKTLVGEWIRANPELVRIKLLEVAGERQAGFCERTWINKFRDEGHSVFNKWPRNRKFENAMAELEKASNEKEMES